MIPAKISIFAVLVCCASVAQAGGIFDSIKGALGIGGPEAEKIVIPNADRNLPNYFRVETELVRISNQAGIQSSGSSCDKTDACDTWVAAYLDTEKPTSAFPGALAIKAIPNVFKSVDTNSPNLGILLTKDICNPKDVVNLKAVARVHVTDHNKMLSDSVIDSYDCPIGGSVADNQRSSLWIDSRCVGKNQPKKIQLFARNRIYRIPASDCSNARPTSAAASKADSKPDERAILRDSH